MKPAAGRVEAIVQKTRVLIVEDEQDIAGLIKHTLERGGEVEAETVGSGDVALKHVLDRPPDLIILDLNLPVVGGLEVCRILRARPKTARVPIIKRVIPRSMISWSRSAQYSGDPAIANWSMSSSPPASSG